MNQKNKMILALVEKMGGIDNVVSIIEGLSVKADVAEDIRESVSLAISEMGNDMQPIEASKLPCGDEAEEEAPEVEAEEEEEKLAINAEEAKYEELEEAFLEGMEAEEKEKLAISDEESKYKELEEAFLEGMEAEEEEAEEKEMLVINAEEAKYEELEDDMEVVEPKAEEPVVVEAEEKEEKVIEGYNKHSLYRRMGGVSENARKPGRNNSLLAKLMR